MPDSRVKNTLLSTFASILEQVVLMIFGLIVPRLSIKTFGSEVNGLTAFISQILNVLSLLQAGMISASIFALYEPIAKHDYEQMNIIVDASTSFFRKIGCLFFALVLLVLPYIIYKEADSNFAVWEIAAATVIMGLNATLTFLFTARYDIIISSYQKRYLLSIARTINRLIYYALVLCVICLKKHFILMYVGTLIANITSICILRHYYRRYTKEWLHPLKEKNTYKIQNRNYLLCNQVVYQVINSLPLLLIANFCDLTAVSVYSINYVLINLLKMVVRAFIYSVAEPFGNFRVLHTKEEVVQIYRLLQCIVGCVIIVFSTCFFCLSTSFISIYTNNISQVQYVVPLFAFSLLAEFFFYTHHLLVDLLIGINGLYKQTYIPIIVAGIVSAVAMLVTVQCFGYEYIPFCSALFYLILYVVFLFVINKELEIRLFTANYRVLFSSIAVISFLYAVYRRFDFAIVNLYVWAVHGLVLFMISGFAALCAMRILDKESVRAGLSRIKILRSKR